MLTKTPPSESPTEDRSPAPSPRDVGHRAQRSPRNSTLRRIVLGIVLTLLLIGLVTAVYFTNFGTEPSSTTVTQIDQTTTPDSTIPPANTQADAGTPAVVADPVLDPTATLTSFGSMWDSADWAGLESMSNADVVATAREWRQDGGHLVVDAEFVPDQCATDATGVATCELIYAPADGFGLIFNITMQPSADGGTITELTFGGDAG